MAFKIFSFLKKNFNNILMIILLLLIIFHIKQREGADDDGGNVATDVASAAASPASSFGIATAKLINNLVINSTYKMIETVKRDTRNSVKNLLASANGGGQFADAIKGSMAFQGLQKLT